MLTEFILCYAITTLASASLLMAWVHTELPILLFHYILRPIFQYWNPEFWNSLDPATTTREDWENKLIIESGFPALLVDLLLCRFCLSFHAAFWISLAWCLMMGLPLFFVLVCVLTVPVTANILIKLSK